jgi:hypothetical protein
VLIVYLVLTCDEERSLSTTSSQSIDELLGVLVGTVIVGEGDLTRGTAFRNDLVTISFEFVTFNIKTLVVG